MSTPIIGISLTRFKEALDALAALAHRIKAGEVKDGDEYRLPIDLIHNGETSPGTEVVARISVDGSKVGVQIG